MMSFNILLIINDF